MRNLKHKNLNIEAVGIGGIESCYMLPQYQVAFDAGRCPYELVDMKQIFLTHGHLDHSAGLPYYFSQRSLKKLPPGEAFVPEPLAEQLRSILKIWHDIEGFEYEIRIHGVAPGEKIYIRKDLYIQPLEAYHRVPAQGYVMVRLTTKLKKQYLGLPGEKIKELKENKEDIFEVIEKPVFAYSGDTSIEFLENNELARKAELLILECTYIDEKRPVSRAREWGHIHLDEIVNKKELFENEKIILTHFSKRYRAHEVRDMFKEKLPVELKNRVEFLK